jgi:hypothetical protein
MEEEEELKALELELKARYEKMERYRKDAAAMRKRAANLDTLAQEEYERARVIRNERAQLQLKIRMAELERELAELRRQAGTES